MTVRARTSILQKKISLEKRTKSAFYCLYLWHHYYLSLWLSPGLNACLCFFFIVCTVRISKFYVMKQYIHQYLPLPNLYHFFKALERCIVFKFLNAALPLWNFQTQTWSSQERRLTKNGFSRHRPRTVWDTLWLVPVSCSHSQVLATGAQLREGWKFTYVSHTVSPLPDSAASRGTY